MQLILEAAEKHTNFIFVGEAGSGKSEIAINFARYLQELGQKKVHFFDLDMTKPLFRSRDIKTKMEDMGIVFHYEEQFMDAPTLTGGVIRLLKDEDCLVVMDVGGDYIGARSIGGFASAISQTNTCVYYVLNAYRPWSYDIDHVDHTLGSILGVSHIELGQIHFINNPNTGHTTTAEEFLNGSKKMKEMVSPYQNIDFSCLREDLYEEVKNIHADPILPIRLYLTYPWVSNVAGD
jgi:hypothetical protein